MRESLLKQRALFLNTFRAASAATQDSQPSARPKSRARLHGREQAQAESFSRLHLLRAVPKAEFTIAADSAPHADSKISGAPDRTRRAHRAARSASSPFSSPSDVSSGAPRSAFYSATRPSPRATACQRMPSLMDKLSDGTEELAVPSEMAMGGEIAILAGSRGYEYQGNYQKLQQQCLCCSPRQPSLLLLQQWAAAPIQRREGPTTRACRQRRAWR